MNYKEGCVEVSIRLVKELFKTYAELNQCYRNGDFGDLRFKNYYSKILELLDSTQWNTNVHMPDRFLMLKWKAMENAVPWDKIKQQITKRAFSQILTISLQSRGN
jgi:hypothetical protein